MTVDRQPHKRQQETQNTAAQARQLLRLAQKAALATFDTARNTPYASLVAVASEPDATPVLLLSALARHTQNITQMPRASLLFDATAGLDDPLQGARVSVFGRVEKTTSTTARQRFLARHPEAAHYADFADFAFYRLLPEGAHFVGGFGRIEEITPQALLCTACHVPALVAAEPQIIAHMNSDHAEAIRLYATRLLGAEDGPWRLVGCDACGCDLRLADQALRLPFAAPVTTVQALRTTLTALARQARNTASS